MSRQNFEYYPAQPYSEVLNDIIENGVGEQSPIPANTFLANATGSTAIPTAIDAATARTLLDVDFVAGDGILIDDVGGGGGASTGITSSTYANGRLTARSYGNGSTRTYSYNGAGQLTVTVLTLLGGATDTLTRTYNPDGTLSTIVRS